MDYLYILLISILYTILFYENSMGLSMIVFTIIILFFTKYYMKKNMLVKNKKGYLFAIPIILLSLTYSLFDNSVFDFLNYLGILFLYNYMIHYLKNKKSTFITNLENSLKLIFDSIRNGLKTFKEALKVFKNSLHLKTNNNILKYLKSTLITLFVLFIIIFLLSSADQIFSNLFTSFFNILDTILFSSNIFYRTIFTFFIFVVLLGLYFSIANIKTIPKELKIKRVENLTIKMILISLNIVYLIFCYIQIKSLFFKSLPNDYIYSEYARQGFFQLLFVSIINIIIIIYSKYCNKSDKNITILDCIMVIFNYIIVFSSFYRMYLYETQYGYTFLRLAVYCFLVYETVIFIPTLFYVFNKKRELLNTYFIIFIIWYIIINYMNFDYIISYNNVNRYINSNNCKYFDSYYLTYHISSSGIDNIIKLDKYLEMNNIDDSNTKDYINYYYKRIKRDYTNDVREFNISRYYAYKKVLSKK